jgi:hypothetical protein
VFPDILARTDKVGASTDFPSVEPVNFIDAALAESHRR